MLCSRYNQSRGALPVPVHQNLLNQYSAKNGPSPGTTPYSIMLYRACPFPTAYGLRILRCIIMRIAVVCGAVVYTLHSTGIIVSFPHGPIGISAISGQRLCLCCVQSYGSDLVPTCFITNINQCDIIIIVIHVRSLKQSTKGGNNGLWLWLQKHTYYNHIMHAA